MANDDMGTLLILGVAAYLVLTSPQLQTAAKAAHGGVTAPFAVPILASKIWRNITKFRGGGEPGRQM